jgi:hypothetical protein
MADAVEERREPETVPPIAQRRSAAYTRRFVLAYVLVIAVFAGMVVLFAILVSRSDSSASRWSSYHPKGRDELTKAQNLANYVAPRYIDEGSPVAVVEAQPLVVQNTLVDGIAFSRGTSRGTIGGGLKQFEPADGTIMYVFCGPGNKCGPSPTATAQTDTLLRRESLELALYTFKYWQGIDSVVALLPPLNGTKPALYLKRHAFEDVLSKPLNRTLPTRSRITGGSLSEAEQLTIDRLTANNVYASEFEILPNGRAVLVLASGTR